MIHLFHKWKWFWDEPSYNLINISGVILTNDRPKDTRTIYGYRSISKPKRRPIHVATGWYECEKCHKVDRDAKCKMWWDR